MKGKIYGVGVGPGDPELLTLKAVRVIKEADLIAFPGEAPDRSVAFKIAEGAVPEIKEKKLIPVDVPMITDPERLREIHSGEAKKLQTFLDEGRDVVFLTLGDPTVYSSFVYLQRILKSEGYEAEAVNGVTSFCAAAARLGISLADRDEPIHIIPALKDDDKIAEDEGTYVIMKPKGDLKKLGSTVKEKGYELMAVSNCGMDNEVVYSNAEDIPDEAAYLTLMIARKTEDI